MGFDAVFGTAFAKSQTASYGSLPTGGRVFVSMANRDKRTMIFPIKRLADLGFEVLATQGTAEVLRRNGIAATRRPQALRGPGPGRRADHDPAHRGGRGPARRQHAARLGVGRLARIDGYEIRTAAVMANIPCITTVQGLGAAVQGIEAVIAGDIGVRSLQDWARAARDASTLGSSGRRVLRPAPTRSGRHHVAFRAIRAARPVTGAALRTTGRPVQAMGLTFPHPLGLAAGFDKNAVGIDALAALGFGHVEIGTVTGEPQPGNPTPRLFRLPADRAVVNRMGFNNDGAVVVAGRLAARRAHRHRDVVVGVNIGKTKLVPEDDQAAVQADYEKSAGLLAPYADYLVVNVSSPNTPGLRSLQAVDRLGPLLAAVRTARGRRRRRARCRCWSRSPLTSTTPTCWPSPSWPRRSASMGSSPPTRRSAASGLVTDPGEVERIGAGGLSGRPVAARSLEVLRLLREGRRRRPEPDLGRRHQQRGRRA